jgi:murein L,D-transpeptidase YcbB/YkuD
MYSLKGSNKFLLFIAAAILPFISCNFDGLEKQGPLDLFGGQLKTKLKAIAAGSKKKIGSVSENVRLTYQLNNYHPVWLNENYSTTENAGSLLSELEDVRWDGIDPAQFHLAALNELKIRLDTTKQNSLGDAIAFDTAMTHNYLLAARELLLGRILPRKADSLWYHANDSGWDAPKSLAGISDKYPSLDEYRSVAPAYNLLREEYKRYTALRDDSELATAISAIHYSKSPGKGMEENAMLIIKKEIPWIDTAPNDTLSEEKQLITAYQGYAGAKPTGKLDSMTLAYLASQPKEILEKISANMERIRWMQQDFGALYIIVDIPLAELFLQKDGASALHMRVVVGKQERQTPSLYATMVNIVINPPWEVPPTILKQDVVPGFEKNGKNYLAKKGLKAYDRKGNLVKSSALNVHNLRQYTYKQAPGDDNSLGFVKFNLPNPWDIYLHDTPHRDDFGKWYRALSSGCIRLQEPQEMAVYILSELEHIRFSRGRLDTLIATHKTRWEALKTKIPVHIAYLTAFEDTTGKHIRFLNDVYRRDAKLISLLKRR